MFTSKGCYYVWLLTVVLATSNNDYTSTATATATAAAFASISSFASATASATSKKKKSDPCFPFFGSPLEEYEKWVKSLDPEGAYDEEKQGQGSRKKRKFGLPLPPTFIHEEEKDEEEHRNNQKKRTKTATISSTPKRTATSITTNGRKNQHHQHGYQRDIDADESPVDEDEVNKLLSERVKARRRRDFDEADFIRHELFNKHGVRVLDSGKLWRSGCTITGNSQNWAKEKLSNNADTAAASAATATAANNNSGRRDPVPFNTTTNNRERDNSPSPPNQQSSRSKQPSITLTATSGHDYTRAPDHGPHASPLSLPEIDVLLAKRSQYRMDRQYDEADHIQDILYQKNVFIDDAKKQWRSDMPFPQEFITTNNTNEGGRPSPFEMSPYSLPLINSLTYDDNDDDDELAEEAAQALQDRIQELVEERLEYRKRRDYDTADRIKEELEKDYGVIIDDKRREWSKGGIFDGPLEDYEMSEYSLPLSSVIEEKELGNEHDESTLLKSIQDLVMERRHAQITREFEKADAILENLNKNYNVAVNDRVHKWSIGGQFHPMPTKEPYTMSEGSDIPENMDVEMVNAKLMERDEARTGRDFELADTILNELTDHGIIVDDVNRQWWPMESTMLFKRAQGGGQISEELEATIVSLLQERYQCKLRKEFDKADQIMGRLKNEFHCRVDDRNMEWQIVVNEYTQGNSPVVQLNEATAALIQEQINQRAIARLRKDFELADKIRDKLAEEYAVCIYEESKEWSVIAPRPSHSNDYNDLGMEPAENDVNKASEGASPSIGNYERYINGSDVAIAQDGPKEVESDDKQMGETASLENLTVVQLKEKLRAKGLPVSGRKAELIERLISG